MKALLTVMGIYFVATGVWPVLSIVSFQMFTGVKKDTWLVRMVGLLATAIGITLLYSTQVSAETPKEIILLSILSCLSFTAIDVIYVMKKTIPKIYLADAAVELVFLSFLAGSLIT